MFRNISIVWKLAFKSVIANWAKNKVIVSIVAVSLVMIQILLALSEGFGLQVKNFALDSLVGNYKIMSPEYKLEPSAKFGFKINDDVLTKINNLDYVKGATKRIVIPAVIKSERSIRNIMLVGVDTSSEKDLSFLGKSYTKDLKQAFANNGILIGAELLDKLSTKIGYKVVISGQNAKEKLVETAFFLSDTFTTSLPQMEQIYVFADIETVNKIYQLDGNISEISIVLSDQNKDIKSEITKILPKKTQVYSWGELLSFLKNWLDIMYINMLVIFIIVFIAATLPLSNTLLISVLERMFEFGVLQAIGLKKIYLMLFILFESFFILLLGLGLGLIGGVLITIVLQYSGISIAAFADGASGLGLGDHIYPKLNMANTMLITSVLFGFGMLVSFYPAIRASLYNVVEALSKKS
jgi:ABC-type lipoprotein release transport system permease subunit